MVSESVAAYMLRICRVSVAYPMRRETERVLYLFVFVSFMCVFVSYLQVLVLGEIEGGGGVCPGCAPLRICVYLCVFASWSVYLRRGHTNSSPRRKYTQIQRWSGRRHFQAKMGTIWSCVYLRVFAHGTNTMCICLYLIVSDGKSSFQIQTVFAV